MNVRQTPVRVVALVTATLITLGLMACGGETTPTPTPGATVPTSQEIRQAGQELFDALSAATGARDGVAFLKVLPKSFGESCTVEQVQGALTSGDIDFPELEVKAVFLDLEEPTRAMVQVTQREVEEGGPEGFGATFPFPMVQEEGRWRLDLLFFLTRGEECPFAHDSASTESLSIEARPPPEVAQAEVHPSGLPRPPEGVTVLERSTSRTGIGVTSVALLETDMELAALLEHYRQEGLDPAWQVEEELVTENLAVVAWSFRDEQGQIFRLLLTIVPAGEGRRLVRKVTDFVAP